MLHKIRKFYYDNKIKIWRVILIIASIFIVIQLLNYMIRERNENLVNNINNINSSISNSSNLTNSNNTFLKSDTSAVTGEPIDSTNLKEASELIDSFISACNDGDIEEAYGYISIDCKKEMYPDINDFKTLYYDNIFGGTKKTVLIENWILNTYKINVSEDIMETGNINETKTQDYITIVTENDEKKLNINNFVENEKINKIEEINGIKFTILNKKIYMDHEEYDIQIENYTEGKILLDSLQDTKSIYIKDNNDTEYYSYSHELLRSLLEINAGFSSKITFKFSKEYSQERITTAIIFSDITFNYNNNVDESNKKQIEIYL